jgi:hypothetical protein
MNPHINRAKRARDLSETIANVAPITIIARSLDKKTRQNQGKQQREQ